MLFWILFFVLIVLLAFVFEKRIYLVWFVLWLFAAFRYKVGTDYMGYVNLFNEFQSGYLNPHYSFDYGLIALLNFVDFVGGSYQLLFLIYATLTMIFFYKGFKYYSQGNSSLNIMFVLMFLSFLYFSVIHIIRFELAGAILFYSTRYLVEKRFWKYLFGIVLATLFHPTAILFIMLYPIVYFKLSFKLIVWFILLSTLIIVLHPLKNIVNYLSDYNIPYLFYITSEKYNTPASFFAIVNTYTYMLFAIFTYKLFQRNRKSEIVFLMFLIFIFVRVLSFDLYIFARLSLYFKPFLIIFLSYFVIYLRFKEQVAKWLVFTLLLFGAMLGSVYGLYARKGLQKIFYTQYAINIGLLEEPYIIDIYGNSNNLPNTNIEQK